MSCVVDVSAYLDALEIELSQLPDGFQPETLYLGGGTPTALQEPYLKRLFDIIHKQVHMDAVREWTCEANPGTLTRGKVQLLKRAGVNRISLGVQSFNDDILQRLKRIHTVEDARQAYGLLRAGGIENINMDLIYGVPGADMDQLAMDINALMQMSPEHISCYCLSYEAGTPLTAMRDDGKVVECSDDELSRMYNLIREQLVVAGYHHYEISNFAKPGYACAHNLLYWGEGLYIGCGPTAWSYWGGHRYGNPEFAVWHKALCEEGVVRHEEDALDEHARACELLVMWLRRLDGVPREQFLQRTGFDYHVLRGAEIKNLCEQGLLEDTGDTLRLPHHLLFVSDRIFSELV